uniref:Methionine biosynthesis protein MetW n=1 Tax=Roseihalotalea indica TaxID=2867963 RepID=A0AA49GQC2_9BACT|nr:hypothetical protein K4G66_07610 [Tunicatimonas sp. TK19036]
MGKTTEYLPNLVGKTVLDVGCGSGALIERMVVSHPEVVCTWAMALRKRCCGKLGIK